jgi:hypothetical protein
MANGIVASEANLQSSGVLTEKLIARSGKASSAGHARALQVDRSSAGRRWAGEQSLVRGLLDPKSSSLSLTALARAAAFSGKRLIIEIRDDNPVRIVRTSTRGM